ncbi:L-fucose:H+ symporter permease [Stakelama saccharophila]|uniref:L-fucose:H+ symporter permease n=1 Tax=Stakelama saccharophila TaxID=3075605 RepID=A0ABZ0B6X2_9SPHN|nr:L-fucose:H+ symporter permease [Stakelama sp. W311]WNO52376.1 L-fucose:H+ symporter permease [Stakelama sp. W311]
MGSVTIFPETGNDRAPRGRFVRQGYLAGFALVTSLFFLWAIANNFNDILIRQFQKALALNRAEAGFIQFVFYLGYFTMALPAGMLMRRFGYRAGILCGLGLYATGALLFYPAAEIREYGVFLAALFVIASGAAFLETAANPYIVAFGDPERASQRLNFAQAFNGFGGFVAPIIGGLFIFSGVEHSAADLAAMSPARLAAYRASEAQMVQTPYLVLALVIGCIALAIAFVRLPRIEQQRADSARPSGLLPVLREPALAGAVIAQFFYVGAQVGVWSFFVDFTKELSPATPERTAAFLLSISLMLFMAGRFIGTALMQRIDATRLLLVFACINIGLAVIAALAGGWTAIGALMLTSFFMSIMFPTIFSLGVKDLGGRAMLGAPLIIMAIIGGAVFPPIMGLVSQWTGHIQPAMLMPAGCFAVVAVYAARVRRIARRALPIG